MLLFMSLTALIFKCWATQYRQNINIAVILQHFAIVMPYNILKGAYHHLKKTFKKVSPYMENKLQLVFIPSFMWGNKTIIKYLYSSWALSIHASKECFRPILFAVKSTQLEKSSHNMLFSTNRPSTGNSVTKYFQISQFSLVNLGKNNKSKKIYIY